jgi:shikimate kinase
MRSQVIALVGLRGAGKTTVGALLAERLGWRFVDTDALVEARAGVTIAEIFAHQGEPAFRALEREAGLATLCEERVVVATGGGAVLDEAVRARLAQVFTVWLQAPIPELAARIERGAGRPSLTGQAPADELPVVLAARADYYHACASAKVDNGEREAREVCDDIELLWRGLPDHDLR